MSEVHPVGARLRERLLPEIDVLERPVGLQVPRAAVEGVAALEVRGRLPAAMVAQGRGFDRVEGDGPAGHVGVVAEAAGQQPVVVVHIADQERAGLVVVHLGPLVDGLRGDVKAAVAVEQPEPGSEIQRPLDGHERAAGRVIGAVGVAVAGGLAAQAVADGPTAPRGIGHRRAGVAAAGARAKVGRRVRRPVRTRRWRAATPDVPAQQFAASGRSRSLSTR